MVAHFQIAEHAVEGLAWGGAADKVHAGLKLHSVACEALQATAGLDALFQNGHLIAVLCQNRSAAQAAKTAADDNYIVVIQLALSGLTVLRISTCSADASARLAP